MRAAEDARACAILNVHQVRLPHADGPYREPAPLTALARFLAALPPSTEVLVPLGINQPDHAAVRDQALKCLTEAGRTRILVFADLPYGAAVPGWGTPDVLRGFQTSLAGLAYREVCSCYGLEDPEWLQLDENEWRRKRDSVLCYATQLSPVGSMDEVRDCGTLLSWPGVLQFEMVWRVMTSSSKPGTTLRRPDRI
jgi:LmbE family N-acetylglucosaminyl deacetylase